MVPKRGLRAILALTLIVGAGGSCMAVERPQYSVELSEPPYEIRHYPYSIVAVTHVDGERNTAVNAGFRTLAGYIFGANQARGNIAMTAPVIQSPGHSIEKTGAVQQNGRVGGWDVAFTMPAAYTLGMLPAPDDGRIRLAEIPPHRVAAIQFSGFWSDANLRSHEAQLLEWLKARQMTVAAPATYAYYDAPWTPWFMRTIEVLVDLAPAPP